MNSHPADRLAEILKDAQSCGLAHNNGAGGQYVLCATEAQLLAFGASLAKQQPQVPAAQSGGAPCSSCNGAGVIGSPGAPCPFCKLHKLTPPQEPTVAQAALQGAIYEAKMSSSYRIGCGRLKAAVEGECDGIALTDQQAGAILEYISGWEESYSQKDVDAAIAAHKAAAQEGA